MSVVTVSQKGWVVIPSELRAKYGWQTGVRVQVVDYGGVVSLVPLLDNPEDEGFGALKRPRRRGRSLLKALQRSRTKERRRERSRK
jgi:AbrB family looped-hinge helix DNA binding protein